MIIRLIGALLLAAALVSGEANAEDWVRPDMRSSWLVFNATSEYVGWSSLPGMQVELYSQNRPGVTWGPFTPDLHKWTARTITCKQDEYICFGAWTEGEPPASERRDPEGRVTSEEWGTGRNNQQGCTACCARCDELVKNISLYRFNGTYVLKQRRAYANEGPYPNEMSK